MKHPGVTDAYQEARRLIGKARWCRSLGQESSAQFFIRLARHEWKFARMLARIVRGLPE